MLKVTLTALLMIPCVAANVIEYEKQHGEDYRSHLRKERFPQFPTVRRNWAVRFTVSREDNNALFFYPRDLEVISGVNVREGYLTLHSVAFYFPNDFCPYHRFFLRFETNSKKFEVVSRVFTPPRKDDAKADAQEIALHAETLTTDVSSKLSGQPSRTTRNATFKIEWIVSVFQIRQPGLSNRSGSKSTYTGPPILVSRKVLLELDDVKERMDIVGRTRIF